jgi:hypothetical protein
VAEDRLGRVLLAADVVVVDEGRVRFVVLMVVVRHGRRAGINLVRLQHPRTGLGGRRHIVVLGRRVRDVRIGDKLVPGMDRVRVLRSGLERLDLLQVLCTGRRLLGRQQLRVLVCFGRGGRRFCVGGTEDLGLLALDLSIGSAVGALQLEVLSYRVVEDPHVAPD